MANRLSRSANCFYRYMRSAICYLRFANYPCLCLCFGFFLQITNKRPSRFTTLQFWHIVFMEDRTFIKVNSY